MDRQKSPLPAAPGVLGLPFLKENPLPRCLPCSVLGKGARPEPGDPYEEPDLPLPGLPGAGTGGRGKGARGTGARGRPRAQLPSGFDEDHDGEGSSLFSKAPEPPATRQGWSCLGAALENESRARAGPPAATHLKTKVPPAPWPSTSLGLKEILPTTIVSGSASAEEGGDIHPSAHQPQSLQPYSHSRFRSLCSSRSGSWISPISAGCSPHPWAPLLQLWVRPVTPQPSLPARTFSSLGDGRVPADHPVSQVLHAGRGAGAL